MHIYEKHIHITLYTIIVYSTQNEKIQGEIELIPTDLLSSQGQSENF